MRFVIRLSLAIAAVSFALLFVTLTVAVIKSQFGGKHEAAGKNHVAVIDLTGVIINSSPFVKELKERLEEKTTKAVVVRINSPGGLVAPSQEIYEAIKKADEKVPVIISMGSLAASGGYYAALGGRKIFANSGTLTASIGVIMEFMNLEKLYAWAKVDRITLKAGKFKDVGSPNRPMRPEEKALLETMLTDIHSQFRAAVKERRKLTDAELDVTADGRIVTGSQALKAKLVDQLGGFEDAAKEARAIAKLPDDAPISEHHKRKGALKEFLMGEDEPSEFSRFTALIPSQLLESPGWKVMLLSPTIR